MNISIASYSFHGLRAADMMDVFGYLESVRHRYGLSAADIWNGTIGADSSVYLNEEFLKKIKAALLERELTLVNYHVDGVHVWDPDPEVRERNYRGALEHLKAAEYLGARTVRIDAGGKGNEMSDEQFDFTVRRYSEYAQRAANGGYRVGPENHWGPSLNPHIMEKMGRAINSPAYGILMHIGHWEVGDSNGDKSSSDGDRQLAPFAMHTHVDANITRTCLQERIAILLEAGYTGCWGVEHHTAKNEYAEVAYQVAAVQRALALIGRPASTEPTKNPLLGF